MWINLIITTLSFSIMIAKGYQENILDDVLTLLSKSNDLEMNTIMILFIEDEWERNSSVYQKEISSSILIKQSSVAYLYVKKDLDKLNMLIDQSNPALIIAIGGNSTKSYQEILASSVGKRFEENIWLFIPNSTVNIDHFNKEISNELDVKNKLSIMSHLYTLETKCQNSRLFELYKPCVDRNPVIGLMYDTAIQTGQMSNDLFVWHRRKTLTGCTIKMVYVNTNKFYEKSMSQSFDKLKHFSIRLGNKDFYGIENPFLENLLTALNFSVIALQAEDNTYGALDERTGEWSGIMGALSQNKADMGAQWLAITPLRRTSIKYSIPFINVEYKLFMRKPEATPKWNTFFHVFDSLYWICLMIAMLFCITCLFIIFWITLISWSESTKNKKLACQQALVNSVAITCKSMITYDVESIKGTKTKIWRSSQLAVFIICIFGSVNYYIYNGGLISSLMVQNYEAPIRKLEDFLTKPEYKIMFAKGGSTESYFSSSTEGYLKRLWIKIQKDDSFITSLDQAENDIKLDSKKILFYPYVIFKYMYDSYPCEIVASDSSYNHEQWAFGFNNQSKYIKLFNYHISKAMELGLDAYADHRETQCATEKEKTFRPVNNGDIFPAFIFALIGCAIAILFCFVEFICSIIR